MPGNDEKTRIEAFASLGCGKMPCATTRGRKNRGVPPPATFDIDTLPGSSNLTALEAAAIIRRTPGALEQWRRNPNHPLKWRYVDGRPLYRAVIVVVANELIIWGFAHNHPNDASAGDSAGWAFLFLSPVILPVGAITGLVLGSLAYSSARARLSTARQSQP